MKNKILLTTLVLFFVFLSHGIVFSQSDIIQETKLNMPGNWGITNTEKMNMQKPVNENKIPQTLIEQYRRAKLSGNQQEKIRTGLEMEKYMEPSNRPPEGTYEKTVIIT